MEEQKCKSFIKLYAVAFFITIAIAAAAMAYVTNIVLFESSGLTFDQELYLEYIRKQVEGTLPIAIAVGCAALLLEYKLLPRLKRRDEIEKGLNLTMGTGIMSFAVWLSYAMFHELSGEYPLMSQAVTWLSLGDMMMCGTLFYLESRRKLSVKTDH